MKEGAGIDRRCITAQELISSQQLVESDRPRFGYSSCHMDWADYLRDEAAKFRQLAEAAEDPSIKQELLDLAAVCEEVANNIEDRMPGG